MKHNQLKIFCFGDSVVWGESDELGGGWCERIKLLALQGKITPNSQPSKSLECFVYNLGIGGETSDGLARRIENELASRVIRAQQNWVIVSPSINDIAIKKNKNTVPLSYFERNMIACINAAKALGCRVILNEMLSVSDVIDGRLNSHSKLLNNADVKIYNQKVSEIALQQNCHLIGFTNMIKASDKQLFAVDGVHLNAQGHEIVAIEIMQQLNQLVSSEK
ncbi:SGNH/GDSL hydrolase family protein [Aliikangiella sp. IMCC44653]